MVVDAGNWKSEDPAGEYRAAIEFLYGLRWFGAKFGLANTLKLASLAGHPQNSLRFIHVAGTNGKGSTCAILESIYRAAGFRVGLFTSPHLVGFCERIQINRVPIPEEEVVRGVARIRPMLNEFSQEEHPTFFEVITVLALQYFAEQKCELVVWETGLGGRLDATNIVQPLASVITNIQYDHQKFLGETLSSIAGEKAGIIKPRTPVITGAEPGEALEVIRSKAQAEAAELVVVPRERAHQPPLDRIAFPLLGEHQKMNAAVALATVEVLQDRLPVSADQVAAGLSTIRWPGRLQLVTRSPGRQILLDGAHNLGGAETLAAALRDAFAGITPVLILGMLRDKDWGRMCEVLAPLASEILLVPVHSERSAEPHGLAEACRSVNPAARVREGASLKEALAQTAQTPFTVLAGSLYLVGEAMELLGLSSSRIAGERGLNEWTSSGLPAHERTR